MSSEESTPVVDDGAAAAAEAEAAVAASQVQIDVRELIKDTEEAFAKLDIRAPRQECKEGDDQAAIDAANAAATDAVIALGEADPTDPTYAAVRALIVKTASCIRKYDTKRSGIETEVPDDVVEMLDQMVASDTLLRLLSHFPRFDFDALHQFGYIFTFAFRQRKEQATKYICAHPQVLQLLVDGHKSSATAPACGQIVRDACRSEPINKLMLHTPSLFRPFFTYIESKQFDMSSDAFSTFQLMLTKHPDMASKFLLDNFESFFTDFDELLKSRNYVAKRQALKFLGELLHNRKNFYIMMKFVTSDVQLEVMLSQVFGKTKAIQYESFHVFKIFLANPRKPKAVLDILLRDREKLTTFLKTFNWLKFTDQNQGEKDMLIDALANMHTIEPWDPDKK